MQEDSCLEKSTCALKKILNQVDIILIASLFQNTNARISNF